MTRIGASNLLVTTLLFLFAPSTIAEQDWAQYHAQHSGPNIDASAVRTCWIVGGKFSEKMQGKPERGYKCETSMKVWTHNDKNAEEFCKSRFPFHIISAKSNPNGGKPETRCTFQVNLVCADGWYQIHNRCYRVLNSQYDLAAAKAACAAFGKTNNFKEAQLAEYHSPNLGIDLEDLNIFEAWVLVPDMSPYFENGEGVEAAVFVLDNAFLYEMKEANLMMADVKSKHEALCQYTPDINMAESFLQGELYNPIYPIITHDLGITFDSGGVATITQNSATGQYDNSEIGKKCAGVGKVIAVKAYPQAALENEVILFKEKLTGHRMYLTGSVKQDGAKITGFRDCDVTNPKAEPHYHLGGHIPCRSDCLVAGNQKAVASWDPAVSMDNTLLHNYNHDGHPYNGADYNKHIGYRTDLNALHSHNDNFPMWVICGRYAKKKAVKLTPKNLA
uniref:C-type lectin domain-containing protein n=1 Tax=Caenorhabditis japonica TaxID=281687 RepID=A0A8R1HJA0_CAEJA